MRSTVHTLSGIISGLRWPRGSRVTSLVTRGEAEDVEAGPRLNVAGGRSKLELFPSEVFVLTQ